MEKKSIGLRLMRLRTRLELSTLKIYLGNMKKINMFNIIETS